MFLIIKGRKYILPIRLVWVPKGTLIIEEL